MGTKTLDVALATCANLPEPDHDEQPTLEALRAAGLSASSLAWDDEQADFSTARMTVLRATWNYPEHPARFERWAERTATVTELLNPLEALRLCLHKRYLFELASRGVDATATLLVQQGSRPDLAAMLDERGWHDVVIKPEVGAASYMTARVQADEIEEGQRHLHRILAVGHALVQPYLSSVEDHGERAVVWIDGEITHAVRKNPRFMGQDESVSKAVPISEQEASLATKAIAAIGADLLYARVDMAPGPTGDPVVMELELIEPTLFFPQNPAALDRLVAGIARRLGR